MIHIVLPAYNEEKALPDLVTALAEDISEEGHPYEITIVNDGSSDNTLGIAKELSNKYPIRVLDNGENKGLATTIQNGLVSALQKAGERDIIVTMDADNTHPAGLVIRMCRLIREGNDVIIASRYRPGAYVRGLSMFRRFLSFGASWLFRILFPMRGVRDYTCGYRAYRVTALNKLKATYGDEFISERGFAVMVDILLRLREFDLIFNEVPLVLRYDQKPGSSKMDVFKTIRETLLLVFKRRFGIKNSVNSSAGKKPLKDSPF